MSNYWEKRLYSAQEKAYTDGVKALELEYKKMYLATSESITKRMTDLYMQMLSKDEIRPNDLYKYNRFVKLQMGINEDLKALGATEIKITNSAMVKLYNEISELVAEDIGLDVTQTIPNGAEKAVNTIWCADGKSWSDRIWKNKLKLQQMLEKSFVDCIVAGRRKDDIVKDIMTNFTIGFNDADRIARTELTHIQNESAYDRYKANGVKQYQYLATKDDRVSEMCHKLDGKVFNMNKKQVGVNFPPMHPNCRCTIVPII